MKTCEYCSQEFSDSPSKFCTLACAIEFGLKNPDVDVLN